MCFCVKEVSVLDLVSELNLAIVIMAILTYFDETVDGTWFPFPLEMVNLS